MHLHILGICGTFMAGLALLARERGFHVSGSDASVYPPMSEQLQAAGIGIHEGYSAAALDPPPDLVVIGNALSRGNPAVEYVLAQGLPYTSGPQWLAEQILQGRWVLAVAGTHGKTTASSLLAWILEYAGHGPGYLIGGVPQNFGASARLGRSPYFVVEADEYDTAFFDKRSKFIHYRPRTLILNNLEYDHADIFPHLEAIQQQFHYLVRTVPNNGLILVPSGDKALATVLSMGCWTPVVNMGIAGGVGSALAARAVADDGSNFEVWYENSCQGQVHWPLLGHHNVANGLAAIGAARHAGVPIGQGCQALERFQGVRRRLEVCGKVNGVTVYDDFAHHPTAISKTLAGLRARVGKARIIAVLEPRSNTMKLGVHKDSLAPALALADRVLIYQPSDIKWSLIPIVHALGPNKASAFFDIQAIVDNLRTYVQGGDHIVLMSNGNFSHIQQQLLKALREEGEGR
ncbi:UDP-N-acetylmuramate, L-alanyl-gamma-D-glutamyl-meso-diaminopimelate ligase [Nitrosococcus oceani ATCC 19707]|uniref:UDP-N-acetylmuramate--L-alanyl-gamma-D-glutamyl-meso-2,6-diaminoheptandioate ligase n=2 Tax=Nitrosococcus oceani TaxID=1229 RepID=Q3J8P1_NITOC|nr:UDP-N-acetylmuramate:L-alanyl-gamma-D-glutamyl-meso-diaminopimelate ligase [Nitrosococcus oceani]ABA58805.1 UDP-N-acetylmuramate, L-alanyl-gamma-D-glutamyl-meso-diaminopimelate ligase [Nitrosococcus oceani ATCC 19707]KFI18613.1 UDP-N-acetylmuramate:L-alanyl-gamma-D-glutamyl-meso-diaminopimelate ligase [Nitrosococcus oceani C-27]GEM19105.1 UDP-N-acetylmuramate:L-alanyl-gamma-D-glutamyl-meso-diaminopimelate ligase [Nitrosococcus oceani]